MEIFYADYYAKFTRNKITNRYGAHTAAVAVDVHSNELRIITDSNNNPSPSCILFPFNCHAQGCAVNDWIEQYSDQLAALAAYYTTKIESGLPTVCPQNKIKTLRELGRTSDYVQIVEQLQLSLDAHIMASRKVWREEAEAPDVFGPEIFESYAPDMAGYGGETYCISDHDAFKALVLAIDSDIADRGIYVTGTAPYARQLLNKLGVCK